MPLDSQSTSTENSGLFIFSSTIFLAFDINFQSRLLVPFADGTIDFASISRLAYLMRNSSRFANRLAIFARNIFTLKGLMRYSSAPIDSPSRILFSSPKAVSNNTGICEISISLLIATHNSSPRISGIMISERTSSGQYSLIIINASFPLAQACTLYIEDNELTR